METGWVPLHLGCVARSDPWLTHWNPLRYNWKAVVVPRTVSPCFLSASGCLFVAQQQCLPRIKTTLLPHSTPSVSRISNRCKKHRLDLLGLTYFLNKPGLFSILSHFSPKPPHIKFSSYTLRYLGCKRCQVNWMLGSWLFLFNGLVKQISQASISSSSLYPP